MVIAREKRKHTLDVDYSKVLQSSILDSLKQLNPLVMLKNPIIFIVEICFLIMLLLTYHPELFGPSILTKQDNFIITILLFLTIFFSNLAENIAKSIGRAQADSLKIVHGDIEVKRRECEF